MIQTMFEMAECRIHSFFAYFVKEILATNDRRTLGGRRKLGQVSRRSIWDRLRAKTLEN